MLLALGSGQLPAAPWLLQRGHLRFQERQMDLLTPLYPAERLHPHFASLIQPHVGRSYARSELLSWLNGFPNRDRKFIEEFQTTFNSSFWEIYLYAVFREYGFEFDWRYCAPDFVLSTPACTFTVEAVTANHANDATPEWAGKLTESFLESIEFNELNRVAIIRLANAFISKSRLFQNKYAKHAHVQGRPFVLAMAPFEQPGFNLQAYRAIEALLFDYYVDEEEYLANPDAFPYGPEAKSLGSVEKDNGAEIELGLFNGSNFNHVSAVVFSNLATWGKIEAMSGNPGAFVSSVWSSPDGLIPKVACASEAPEAITDGLRIYHNPFATHPLPGEVFRRGGVVQVWANLAEQTLVGEQAEACLQSRSVLIALRTAPDDPI